MVSVRSAGLRRPSLSGRPVAILETVLPFGETTVQDVLNMLHDQINSHKIVCASGDDDICILFSRKAELLEGWLHKGDVLVQNLLQLSPSLTDVP